MSSKDIQEPSESTNNATTPKKMRVKRLSKEKVEVMSMSVPSDNEVDEEAVKFQPPDEGTPAAKALQANADIKVTRLEKGIRRIKGIKHPKAKNFTKLIKKKKDKNRAFSRNFKGKVIDGVHELYTITAGMMLGLRYSVGRSNTTSIQNLLLGDFSYVEKISFPPDGNNQPPFRTPPHQLAHTFKFKTYAPLVFSKLRDFFGVDSMSYMLSICGNYNYLEFISNSKSGQFFFYSHDGRYMIKTQTNEENKFMKRILPHYYRYVTENPHTFLVRIYGMHRVKMYHLHRKTHFVIMQSVFDTPEPIQTIYDLKGSVVGRNASEKERKGGGVLKDNDLIEDGVKLQLGSKRQAIIDQLEKDANFLAELNIMDYSVLLGIHNRETRAISDAEPHVLNSNPSACAMTKRRSLVPFRLKDLQQFSTSTDNQDEKRTPKRRRSSAEQESSRSLVENGLDDLGSVELVSEEGDDSENELSICEYDDDEDAGDSDLSVVDDTEGIDSKTDFKDIVASLSCEDSQQSEEEKKSGGLTGLNLNAVGKKSGVGKAHGETSSIHSSSIYATVGSATVGSHTDPSAYNSGNEEDEDEDEGAGIGLAGEEGRAISKMFKDNVDLSAVASAGTRISMGHGASPVTRSVSHDLQVFSKNLTFGPGATRKHPWTGRYDGGINSRLPDGRRGKDIYYIGVIDILQQYNASKQMETLFKGLKHKKSEISSVDSVSYAKRFVQFMKDNSV